MRNILQWILALVVLCGVVSCDSTPSYVISKEKMAQLLADFHTAEGVVDVEHGKFGTDSMRKALKQSVLLRHGVTQEQMDTSFDWYGHHIKEYMDVYDRTIEILEKREAEVEDAVANEAVAVVGDSADAWQGSRVRILSSDQPLQYVDFVLKADDSWEAGDAYEWRMKMLNNRSSLEWAIFADYTDGTTEYVSSSNSTEGWHTINLYLDGERSAVRIYGYATVSLTNNERVYLDSISLVRTRVNRATLLGARSRQSIFKYGRKDDAESDD